MSDDEADTIDQTNEEKEEEKEEKIEMPEIPEDKDVPEWMTKYISFVLESEESNKICADCFEN